MANRIWLFLLVTAAHAQEGQQPAAQEKPRGYLGVRIGPLDAGTRTTFGIPAAVTEGVVILEAMPGTAAEKAGLKAGDVLIQLAGAVVRSPEELTGLVRGRAAGDEVAYVLRRGEGTIDGRVILGTPPAPPPAEVPLEQRLDRVQRDIEELDRRLRRHPRTVEEWRRAEARKLEEARERGDREAIRRAEIRVELLQEMEAEGARGTADRLDGLERKLDRILERLGER